MPSIIFVCQRVPYPPNRGDRITTWNFIRHLSEKYNIHLFCLSSDIESPGTITSLERYCKTVNVFRKPKFQAWLDSLLSLAVSARPVSSAYYFSRKMKRQIESLVKREKIEIVYCFSSNMFSHVFDLDIKKVFHLADVDSEKWKTMAEFARFPARALYRLESLRLRKWELACSKISAISVLCTDKEMKLFRSIGAEGRAIVIKNGVDIDYFRTNDTVIKEQAIIFTGVMDYFPNVDAVLYFYDEIFPLVKTEVPAVKFYIVGQNPTDKIRELSSKDSRCVVTGYVNDVRPYMDRAMLFVAPMRVGQGIQNKILEALSMELPVITNPKVAESLSLGDREGIIVVDSPEDMAKNIINLLRNADYARMIGQSNRKAVLGSYSWGMQFQVLDTMLGSI